MIVREPSLEPGRDEVVLKAAVESENGGLRPFTLEIAVADAYGDWVDPSANPFVPAATALATTLGEDLRIEAAVSPKLREGAERASRLYSDWWGYRPIGIEAAADAGTLPAGPGTGLFYSNGVDSTATLLRSLERVIPEQITHLVCLQDLNPHYSRRTERVVWERLEAAAGDYDLPLIRMRTSATDVLRREMGWTRAFGALLAGCALAVGPLLREHLYGATVADEHPRPRGSHPDLDPLWGTERTSFRHDATELTRTDRILLVGASPRALRHLKVCWLADTPGNCGRCFKCLRAMTTLALRDDDAWERAFEQPLTPEAVLGHDLKLRQVPRVEDELLPSIGSELPELRAAWEQRVREVRRHGPQRPLWFRLRRAARKRWRRYRGARASMSSRT